MKRYGMFISPIEGKQWYECEAETKKEAIEQGQNYANNNLCYGVDDDSVEELEQQEGEGK